jgi:hypothetical protein
MSMDMRNAAIGLLVCLLLTTARVRADISIGSMSPDEVRTALAAIDIAKKIAEAGRTSLLMAGPVLATTKSEGSGVVAVLDYPNLAKMLPGSVLLLAKRNCDPIEDCLVARRVIGRDATGGLQTEQFGFAEPLLLDQIQATLLGSVVYTVDLRTGDIRDMRPDRRLEHLSLAEALAQEAKR